MKKHTLATLLAALLLGSPMTAQQAVDVDRTKYPDYTEKTNPDWSLMTPVCEAGAPARNRAAGGRPDHVNNAETRYFPPVFNQDGGSCGSASRICYMFSYELAAYRDLDASKPENYYPSHFVWLHTNSPGNQGKDAFVMHVGVPSAATYGGQTYSSLFGYQEESDEDFGWMQGYDKWFEAMHNRMLQPSNFPVNVGTEEGREAVKNWLWNHNGDSDFQAGGICGIGVASGGVWKDIPKTAVNDEIGVTGMGYVHQWGTQVDHALTIVGYDDRIEFDLDKDGIYGEPEADELGAWIIVNSWGNWENNGFIYCPYAHGVPAFNGDGTVPNNFWTPEIYKVRKDYRPLRTIKLKMDYSRRSEIALSAGISADINATEPEKTTPFVHFTYAGDGKGGNSNPAPEVPMLGRWADGKLHDEPMEFGYDLTDLTSGYDMNRPLKYFFIIDSREWAEGEGKIYNASIMDYQYDLQGLETPFGVGEGVEVRNAGGRTIISVVVYGSSYYAPLNVAFDGTALSWNAPQRSALEVESYSIYCNGMLVGNVPAGTLAFTPKTPATSGEYAVSALYTDGNESEKVAVKVPVALSSPNVGVKFSQAGFTVPGVFATTYRQATIEYWIKPATLTNWNQSGGPGWGTFMFHANADGRFTVGWDTSNRLYSGTPLKVGQWTHVAIVVDNNKMTIYLDGQYRGSFTSNTYSGIGGFGDLKFSSNGAGNAQNGVYDEIRIWNTARTEEQIKACKNVEFTGNVMPQGLIAYLKGELVANVEGEQVMFDCVGGHHATLQGSYTITVENMPVLGMPEGAPAVSVNAPEAMVYAGVPVTLTAVYDGTVNHLEWTAEAAGIERLAVVSPTVTFATAGRHTVSVTAATAAGLTTTATCEITVLPAPEIDATFTVTATRVPAGERVTFLAANPMAGYLYEWSMPGADAETASTVNAATSYQAQGTYTVTLTVTAPDGSSKSHSAQVEVLEVAPEAAFSVSPAVVIRGQELTLTDESLYTPTQWEWHVGNGNTNYIAYNQSQTFTIDKPGVYTVTLTAGNNAGSGKTTRERAIIVTNDDSKNGLLFSGSASVSATKLPLAAGQKAFTIEWWMNAGWPADNTNGIGDNEQTMMVKTMNGGKMQLCMGGKQATTSNDFVIPNEWHHYAVIFVDSKAKFYRDGVLVISRPLTSIASLPAMQTFRIGGSAAPFKGSIDEMRVWGKALTDSQLRTYTNAPIDAVAEAETADKLALYYSFNQSGGDVQDATSNVNHGKRTGFGPDGDAWGLSKGVFCLNFDEGAGADITAQYLVNYSKPFTRSKTCVNPNLSERTFAITDWKLENVHVNGSITTGAHVDAAKNNCLTVTTKWDGFESALKNHKVYQTVTLPAGYYTFTAAYDDQYEGQCGSSYLVVAAGNTLPVTEELNQALAYTAMKAKGQAAVNEVSFILTEETTVSVGLLVNMSGESCMALKSFTLTQSGVTIFKKSSDMVVSVAQLSNEKLYYVSQPYHEAGITSWAVAEGGDALKSNVDLSVGSTKEDSRQLFAFVSNDEGATRYLYHVAEKKFVNKDGTLADTPADAIYFKAGAYDTTFVAYFDEAHYINVGGSRQMVINTYNTPDGGNSCVIVSAGSFNPKEALAKFPAVEVTEVVLNQTAMTLMEGTSLALQATVLPGYATDKTVKWSTSNPDVAIVVRGVVSALAPGEAVITAKAGDKEATCVVTVEKKYVSVTGIFLDKTKATVTEGDALTLTATVLPADADDKTVTWETSDATVATVEDGVVTALVPGVVTITAKAGELEASCVITVEERYIPVTEIVLNHTEAEITVGESLKLTATVLPEDATDNSVSWATSDKKVATARNGVVKGVAPGKATITARIGDITATCEVTVVLADGIEQAAEDKAVMTVYDVTGRPVKLDAKSIEGLEQGIYIINGRKTVVK